MCFTDDLLKRLRITAVFFSTVASVNTGHRDNLSTHAHRRLRLRVKSRPEPEVALVQLVETRLLKRLAVHDLPQLIWDVRGGPVDPPLSGEKSKREPHTPHCTHNTVL